MGAALSPTGKPLLTEDDGPVRVLTLNRPERLNAFTAESYGTLRLALADAAARESVRVVVLRGAGRAFSSGVDLAALADTGSETLAAEFEPLIAELATFPKPLLAAVHGAAVGFGMTILLYCDLVLVANDARLRAPFAELGTAPEAASSWLLPRRVGMQRAADILLTGRWVGAQEAVDTGIAARCCADTSLHAETLTLATEIAQLDPSALAATKRLLRHDWAQTVPAVLAREFAEARSLGGLR
jgi:enoyl-CoA hydratase/carnithine racemase